MPLPRALRWGRAGTIITAIAVVAIVVSGVAIGQLVGSGIEARVAPPAERRNVARAEPVRAPASGFYWGAFRDGAPYDRTLIEQLEVDVGSRPSLVMWYHEWHGRQLFPTAEAIWLSERGIVPVISWEPWRPPVAFGELVVKQPAYTLARIAGGSFDRYIRAYADRVREYGGPLMLRPFHEMDGYWYPWSGLANGNTAADFVRAWRHVHDVFTAAGATNVTWVWSVNHVSVPDTPENDIANYWPGPRYVDWTGISGFNWGRASPLSAWKGIDATIGARYAQLLRYDKPIALMETGAPEIGGDKAAWITSTFARLGAAYPGIDAAIWYDRRDSNERDWRIDSSARSLAAFRAAVGRPPARRADAAWSTTLPGSDRGARPFSDAFSGTGFASTWRCTATQGIPAVAAAAGGRGTVVIGAGPHVSACLAGGEFANTDAAITVGWSAPSSGSRRNEAALLVRATHASRHYAFALSEGDGSAAVATIRRTAFGRIRDLATVRLPFVLEPGVMYRIAGRATTEADGVHLAMRVWRDGGAPPTGWSLTITDGGRERLARGQSGFALATDDGPITAWVDAMSVR